MGAAGWERCPSPFPPFILSYEVQLGDSLVSMRGCSLECWKDVVEKACCPGYWGSQCYGRRGGSPCFAPHTEAPGSPSAEPAGVPLHLLSLASTD